MPEFTVEIVRIGYASKTINIDADSLEEAESIARENAGNYDGYSEYFSEYDVDGWSAEERSRTH